MYIVPSLGDELETLKDRIRMSCQRIWQLGGTRRFVSSSRLKLLDKHITRNDTPQKTKPNITSQLAKTRDVVRVQKNVYYDPENTTLNLNLNNAEILRHIKDNVEDRMNKRYDIPSQKWNKIFQAQEDGRLKSKLQKCLNNATISPDTISQPLGVGDLVTLGDDTLALYIVVAQPDSLGSNTCTFINNEGEIIFGSKSMILMRFPGVIDEELLHMIKTFVQLEKKYENIPPIGVPDAAFSRSDASAPKGSISREPTMAVSSEKDEADVNTEFIVAQASSQLLTNSTVNTFVVPTTARNLYSEQLSNISITAFDQVPQVSKRLEVLHRALQYSDSGDIFDSPHSVYIFDLIRYLQVFDYNVPHEPHNTFYLRLKEFINEKFHQFDKDGKHLGKLIPDINENKDQNVPVSTFLALITALRTQGRLWKVNQQGSSNPPLSVTVLPLKNADLIAATLDLLLSKKGEANVATEFVNAAQGKKIEDSRFLGVIELFRAYVAGNFTNDSALEARLAQVIRLIDRQLGRNPKDVPLMYEFSRSRCFELLQDYESTFEGWLANPASWNTSLLPPYTGVLLRSDLSADYYNYLGLKYRNSKDGSSMDDINLHSNDPLESHRSSYGNQPVYCIDSEHAHEIDDGVSIRTDGDYFKVLVHVADPTSYIKLSSDLSNIAFEKGTTTYLPEGPLMMLPKFVSDMCGLGTDKETRTFVVEFEVEKQLVDDFLDKKGRAQDFAAVLREVSKQIKDTANVRFSKVNNFPQNFTYSQVNEILESTSLDKDIVESSHATNLLDLYNMAQVLHSIRVNQGDAMDINLSRSSILVSYEEGAEPGLVKLEQGYKFTLEKTHRDKGHPVITVENNVDQRQNSKSQELVSNLMVAANTLASHFASKHGIQLVHRVQELGQESKVLDQLRTIIKGKYDSGAPLSVEETTQVLSVLTTARYQVSRNKHEALGVDGYATVTSPLRRFVDMVNHWKFQMHFLQTPLLLYEQLQYVCHHLQAREMINKQVQGGSNKFWEGKFYQHYVWNGSCQIPFRLLIRSHPQFGTVQVGVVGFDNLRAKLESSPGLMSKFKLGDYEVGKIADGPFRISKLDIIEDEVLFSYDG